MTIENWNTDEPLSFRQNAWETTKDVLSFFGEVLMALIKGCSLGVIVLVGIVNLFVIPIDLIISLIINKNFMFSFIILLKKTVIWKWGIEASDKLFEGYGEWEL